MDKGARLHIKGIDRPIEDTYERSREAIPDGDYTQEELATLLADGWLPYFECHKCGWFETCQFPERVGSNPERGMDIQCGVATSVLNNCLRAWWPRLLQYQGEQIQDFIDALFHLIQYVYDSHIGLGMLLDWDPEWWGEEMSARLTAAPLYWRPALDQLAAFLRRLPFDFWPFQVAFVEGEAEAAFLQVLRDRRQLRHVDRIEVLGGKGNATRERIPLGLLHRKGYSAFLQLDRDGSKKKSYRELAKQIETLGGSVFIFAGDFESAFPAPILAAGLRELEIDVDEKWLDEKLSREACTGIINMVEQKYECSIAKPKLAGLLAAIVGDNWSELVHNWPSNEVVRWMQQLM